MFADQHIDASALIPFLEESGIEVGEGVDVTQTHFYRIAKPWHDLGFAVIPSNAPLDKTPLRGLSWKQFCGEGRVAVSDHTFRQWCHHYGDHEGLLLTNSNTKSGQDLVVVDADKPELFGWVEQTFGQTPYRVESGRDGGGRHYYYAAPAGQNVTSRNGMIGPTDHFEWLECQEDKRKSRWKGYIDLKSHRAYVACPGSLHKSGRVYTGSAAFSLSSLPRFDVDLYEGLAKTSKPTSKPKQDDQGAWSVPDTKDPSARVYVRSSTYERLQGDPGSKIPFPGPWAGKTIATVVAALGPDQKVICGCPFHNSISGKSATLRVLTDGSWRLTCHVEKVTYAAQHTEIEADPAYQALLDARPPQPTGEERARALFEEMRTGQICPKSQVRVLLQELRAEAAATSEKDADLPLLQQAALIEAWISEELGDLSSAEVKMLRSVPEERVPPDSDKANVARGFWIQCRRGCVAVKPREGGYSEWKLACKSHSCPDCGPWLADVRRASLRVGMRLLGGRGWVGAALSSPLDPAGIRAVQRWEAEEAPGFRAWLRVQTATGPADLILWLTMGDRPDPCSALGRVVSNGELHSSRSLEAWADDVTSRPPPHRARARLISGTEWLCHAIHGTRDALASRPKDQTEPEHLKTRVFKGDPNEFRSKMQSALGMFMETTVKGAYKQHTFSWTYKPATEESAYEAMKATKMLTAPGSRVEPGLHRDESAANLSEEDGVLFFNENGQLTTK